MNESWLATCIVSALLILPGSSAAQEDSKLKSVKVAELDWIAGNWSSDEAGTVTEEQWLEPRAGMMVGMNRMAFPNGKGTFEFLRIAETENGIAYLASPSGSSPTSFAIKSLSKFKVVFENKKNAFPQRIIYERTDNTMVAMIEGEVNGKNKSMQWIWKRTPAK